MIPALLSVFLLVSDTPVTAAETAGPAAQEAPAAEPAKKIKEKKICRAEESEPGSRMRKLVCLTREQWAKRDASDGASDR